MMDANERLIDGRARSTGSAGALAPRRPPLSPRRLVRPARLLTSAHPRIRARQAERLTCEPLPGRRCPRCFQLAPNGRTRPSEIFLRPRRPSPPVRRRGRRCAICIGAGRARRPTSANHRPASQPVGESAIWAADCADCADFPGSPDSLTFARTTSADKSFRRTSARTNANGGTIGATIGAPNRNRSRRSQLTAARPPTNLGAKFERRQVDAPATPMRAPSAVKIYYATGAQPASRDRAASWRIRLC